MPAVLQIRVLLVMLLALASSGCELVGDIFQAGMAVGIIAVVLLVGAVVFVISRLRA